MRVLGVGPEAARYATWHCDIERVYDEHGDLVSRAFRDCGRLVVGLDTLLRVDVEANIRSAAGELLVTQTVEEPIGARRPEQLEVLEPPNAAIVTRDTHSLVEICDPDYSPDLSAITAAEENMLMDMSSTTLHSGVAIDDAFRVSLQCWYTRHGA
jgi:hypothetical protein